MKVLFVASECVPFAKTGGLGDVISALPIALSKLDLDIRVIIPFYRQVKEFFHENSENFLETIVEDMEIGFESEKIKKTYTTNVYESRLLNSHILIYFIDIQELFDRPNIYVDENGKGFIDSAEIYAHFCKAVLDTIIILKDNWYPDIVHANDWHTGLLPLFLAHKLVLLPNPIKTIFTIHNIAYQGKFPLNKLDFLGFSNKKKIKSDLTQKNKSESVNFLKAGILSSDIVTTVSETYRNELLTPEYGFGLEKHLVNQKDSFVGILNGVDYSLWNPSNDELIKKIYSAEDLNGKLQCKHHLLSKVGIQLENKDIAVIGMVTRIDHQKGIELIIDLLPKLKDLNVHVFVVGTGNKKFEEKLSSLSVQLDYFTFIIEFSNQLAHEIEAGSDLFLMPSKFEPCGLNQLYSLKYGTIPIVRKTGGLADSIVDLEEFPEQGNGFTFIEFNASQLENTIRRAVSYYHSNKNTEFYSRLLKNIMNMDYSWQKSALKYKKLYQDLITT